MEIEGRYERRSSSRGLLCGSLAPSEMQSGSPIEIFLCVERTALPKGRWEHLPFPPARSSQHPVELPLDLQGFLGSCAQVREFPVHRGEGTSSQCPTTQ